MEARLETARWIRRWLAGDPPHNLWLGTTAEDQKMAELRLPELLATPAARRFVSCEPLLGPIDLTPWLSTPSGFQRALRRASNDLFCTDREAEAAYEKFMRARHTGIGTALDWVIVGGESGRHARDNGFEATARALLAQCRAAGVAFFGKQNVKKRPLPQDLLVHEWPDGERADCGESSNA